MAIIDSAIETGARAWKDRESGQSGLFATLMEEQPAADHPLPRVVDWTGQEKLTGEKETLGFYITGHPLDQYMDKVKELATHTTGQWRGSRRILRSHCAAFPPVSSAGGARKASYGRPCSWKIWKAQWKRWCFPLSMSACFRCSRKIKRCWCAAWFCRRKTPRRRYPCRKLFRSRSRASASQR